MVCERLRASVKVLPLDLAAQALPKRVCFRVRLRESETRGLEEPLLVSSSPVETKSKYLHPKALRLWDGAGAWREGRQALASIFQGPSQGTRIKTQTKALQVVIKVFMSEWKGRS